MRVVLADDHTLVRAGVRRLLEGFIGVEVVAEAENGREAMDMIVLHRPDVVVTDLSMPGKTGFDVIGETRKRFPEIPVIVLSMHADVPHVQHALECGAVGFVVKEAAPAELELALRAAAQGQTFLSPRVSGGVVSAMLKRKPDAHSLSPRQQEILAHLARGRTTKEIASLLNLSVKTIETHRARMMETLGLHGANELLRYAVQHAGMNDSE